MARISTKNTANLGSIALQENTLDKMFHFVPHNNVMGNAAMNEIKISSEDSQPSTNNIDTNDIDILRLEFETIKDEATIPKLFGVAGAVIEQLQKRMGKKASYDIDDIAEELQLTKRTLQRHLSKQGVGYASLHDTVRYNVAIDCLLKKRMSVEATAVYLGFSDRTSFTSAFKRWSSISPGAFYNTYWRFA